MLYLYRPQASYSNHTFPIHLTDQWQATTAVHCHRAQRAERWKLELYGPTPEDGVGSGR